MENVTQLGYYAKDKNKDLHQFEWDEDSNFYIQQPDGKLIKADVREYEILEIAYINSELEV